MPFQIKNTFADHTLLMVSEGIFDLVKGPYVNLVLFFFSQGDRPLI